MRESLQKEESNGVIGAHSGEALHALSIQHLLEPHCADSESSLIRIGVLGTTCLI